MRIPIRPTPGRGNAAGKDWALGARQSRYFRLKQGATYTFSLWAKADKNLDLEIGVRPEGKGGFRKHIKVTPE